VTDENGIVSLLINSTPVVIFPHWSEPAACIIQPFSLYKWTKSYPCNNV
jgi:hypothetical protein